MCLKVLRARAVSGSRERRKVHFDTNNETTRSITYKQTFESPSHDFFFCSLCRVGLLVLTVINYNINQWYLKGGKVELFVLLKKVLK